jgi:hypothetical protein
MARFLLAAPNNDVFYGTVSMPGRIISFNEGVPPKDIAQIVGLASIFRCMKT